MYNNEGRLGQSCGGASVATAQLGNAQFAASCISPETPDVRNTIATSTIQMFRAENEKLGGAFLRLSSLADRILGAEPQDPKKPATQSNPHCFQAALAQEMQIHGEIMERLFFIINRLERMA